MHSRKDVYQSPKDSEYIADPKEEQKPRTFKELETHFPFKLRLQNRYQSHRLATRKSITINHSSLSNRIYERRYIGECID